MDTPIPLALSRLETAASIAMATNITDSRQPIIVIINPVDVGSKNNKGMPEPIKKANEREVDKPVNKLSHICFRLRG